jgi:hypothetical protein
VKSIFNQNLESNVLSVSDSIHLSSVKNVSDQNLTSSVLSVSGRNQISGVARIPDVSSNGIKRKAARGSPPGTIRQHPQATTKIPLKGPRSLHQTRLYYPPKWAPHSN